MSKKILLSISDGMAERNLLKTDFFQHLKDSSFKEIHIVSSSKEFFIYLKEKYIDKKVTVHYEPYKIHKIDALFTYIFRNTIHTRTVTEEQFNHYKGINGRPKIPLILYVAYRLLWFLGQFKIWRSFLRFLYWQSTSPHYCKRLLRNLKPDIVFVPSINLSDYKLIQTARKERMLSVQMIKSWDNLTSKTFLACFPDYLVVHNEIIKQEAILLNDMPEERIFISGIPQFDYLFKNKDRLIQERERFYRSLNIEPSQKIILFSVTGGAISPHDKDFLSIIDSAIESGDLPKDVHVQVRLHPKNPSDMSGVETLKNITIEKPFSYLENSQYWIFEEKDIVHWINSLCHSACVINMASTMAIDAAIFDKPIVCLAFNGFQNLPFEKSTERYYVREHFEKLVNTEAIDVVKNKMELIVAIKKALMYPETHQLERKQLVEEQCYKLDGRSSERLASFLVSTAK